MTKRFILRHFFLNALSSYVADGLSRWISRCYFCHQRVVETDFTMFEFHLIVNPRHWISSGMPFGV